MRQWKSYIIQRVNTIGHHIANQLQQRTNSYSSRRKKCLLFFFCSLFVSSSILVIIHAFDHSIAKPLRIQAIPKPLIAPKHSTVVPITRQEYERIERYKQQIISLPKPRYDSLIAARPHLMDSIQLFENIYQSQVK